MDAEVAARAFEPMFTTKASGQGTGLGLATVYTIVMQAGGMIDLSSDPGNGTSIEIFLPASDGGPAQATRPTRAAPAGRGESVLIAEDDIAVRRVAERILGGAGYSVVSAGGGVEALELLDDRGAHFDLLLADVVMPGMRGDDLARRAVAMRPGLHVLFMSGYSDNAPPDELGATSGRVYVHREAVRRGDAAGAAARDARLGRGRGRNGGRHRPVARSCRRRSASLPPAHRRGTRGHGRVFAPSGPLRRFSMISSGETTKK